MFVNRAKKYARDLYTSASPVAEKLFQSARSGLSTTSNILGKTGDILSKVNTVANQILTSSELKSLAQSDPNIRKVYNSAEKTNNLIAVGSNLAGKTSQLTNERNYGRNVGNNVNNGLERIKEIRNDANMINYV